MSLRSVNGSEATILDCQGTLADPHRAFRFHSGEGSGVVIEGFRMRNGYAGVGGAVEITGSSSPTFADCTIAWNPANFHGAGLFVAPGREAELEPAIVSFSSRSEAVHGPAGTVTLGWSDVFANAGGGWTGGIASQVGGSGNFSWIRSFASPPASPSGSTRGLPASGAAAASRWAPSTRAVLRASLGGLDPASGGLRGASGTSGTPVSWGTAKTIFKN